jgi:hypothetical protein
MTLTLGSRTLNETSWSIVSSSLPSFTQTISKRMSPMVSSTGMTPAKNRSIAPPSL